MKKRYSGKNIGKYIVKRIRAKQQILAVFPFDLHNVEKTDFEQQGCQVRLRTHFDTITQFRIKNWITLAKLNKHESLKFIFGNNYVDTWSEVGCVIQIILTMYGMNCKEYRIWGLLQLICSIMPATQKTNFVSFARKLQNFSCKTFHINPYVTLTSMVYGLWLCLLTASALQKLSNSI